MSEEEFYSKALSFDELGMQVDVFEKEKRKYEQKIAQLTNNWNELEEWIMQDVKDEKPDLYFQVLRKVDILDKMKEIKEKNNG